MRILCEDDLGQFFKELREQLPQSLTTYMMVKNRILKNQFAWQGFEFVVDRFPGHSASLIRPAIAEKPTAWFMHNRYAVHATSADALKTFLDEPDVVDWSKPVFFSIDQTLAATLYDACRKHGAYIGPSDRPDFEAFAIGFSPEKLTPCPDLPAGFSVRSLEKSELKIVNSIWALGKSKASMAYLVRLHDQGFPTLGVFAPDGDMAGYCLTGAEFILMAAYVFDKYRNQKLFHILTYHWCQKMFELGMDQPYGFVCESNIRSHTSLFRAGGKRLDWSIVLAIFVPLGYTDTDNPVLKWYGNLGTIIWKQ